MENLTETERTRELAFHPAKELPFEARSRVYSHNFYGSLGSLQNQRLKEHALTEKEQLTYEACAALDAHLKEWFKTKKESFRSTELGEVKKAWMDAHPEYKSCEMDIEFDYIEKSRTYKEGGCSCCGDQPKIVVNDVYAKPMKWEEISYLGTAQFIKEMGYPKQLVLLSSEEK